MSDGQVTLTANARFNKLENAYARVQNKVQSLEQKNAQLANQLRNTQRAGARGSGQWLASLASVAAGYVSISQAINVVREAHQRQIDLSKRAAEADITQAQADDALVLAAHGFSEEQVRRLKKTTQGASLPEGFEERHFTAAVAKTLSGSTGDKETRIKHAVAMMEAAAPMFVHEPEGLGAFGAAAVAVQKSGRGQVSAEGVLSMMTAFRSESPVQTLETLRNVAPVLAAADISTAGSESIIDNLAIGAGVLSAMATRLADTDMSLSGTAAANFFTDLRTAAPGQKDILARLQAVQADEGLRETFIKTLKGRAITKSIGENLSRGGVTFEDMIFSGKVFKRSMTDTTDLERTKHLLKTLTPALSRATEVRASEAEQDVLLRERFGFRGAAERMMLGPKGVISTQPGFWGGVDAKAAQMQFSLLQASAQTPAAMGHSQRAIDLRTLEASRLVLQRQIAQETTPEGKAHFQNTLERIERAYMREQEHRQNTQEAERRGQVRGAAAAHVNAHSE